MRKIILALAVLILLVTTVILYPTYVEKPVKDGAGPLAVYISAEYAAPEYHSPLDFWETHHMDMVNRGDLEQADCLYCHIPESSCNNCHDYVGAQRIEK